MLLLCSVLDNRTRHEHRQLHGQRRNVDEPFEVDGIKILYPAELNGKDYKVPESMIWNCRCTLLAWVKGFEGDTVKSSPKMGDMSFEEWQNEKTVAKSEKSGIMMMQDDRESSIPARFVGNYDDFEPLSISKDEVKLLNALNDLAAKTGTEHGRIIGEHYDTGIYTSGLTNRVYVPKDCFGYEHLRFYHSHTNETLPSAMDLSLLTHENTDSVSVKTINGDVFSVSIGNGYRPTTTEYDDVAIQANIDSMKYIEDYPDYSDWTENQRVYMAIREQAYLIVRKFGWRMEGGKP